VRLGGDPAAEFLQNENDQAKWIAKSIANCDTSRRGVSCPLGPLRVICLFRIVLVLRLYNQTYPKRQVLAFWRVFLWKMRALPSLAQKLLVKG
jgi:hypothetical protein